MQTATFVSLLLAKVALNFYEFPLLFWREISSEVHDMEREERRVKVAVAVRSLSEEERTDNEENVVGTQGNEVKVLNPETRREKVFKFDYTVS